MPHQIGVSAKGLKAGEQLLAPSPYSTSRPSLWEAPQCVAILIHPEQSCLAWISRSSCASTERIIMTGYESQTCCRWNPGLTSNLGQHCHTHNMCPCATMDSISAGKFSFEIYATLRLTSAVYKLSRASNSERVPDPLPAAQSCVAGHTRLLHPVYPNGASRGVCLILYTTQRHCVCEHAYGKTQPRGIILRLRGAYIRLDCAIHRPRHI